MQDPAEERRLGAAPEIASGAVFGGSSGWAPVAVATLVVSVMKTE